MTSREAMEAGWRLLLLLLLCMPLTAAAAPAGGGWSHSGPAGPVRGQVGAERPAPRPAGPSRRHRQDAADAVINVNTAGASTLVALKGIGEKKARAIVAYRKAHGPFASLDDFEQVPGIGPALIEANRDRILFR